MLRALVVLADTLTPSPLALEPVEELWCDLLMRWRDLTSHPNEVARLHPSWQRRLDELVELEGRWPELATGDTLLHLDIRADNVLLTDDHVYFVDWPWAVVGAPWLDVVAFLPSVGMQGGPDPD